MTAVYQLEIRPARDAWRLASVALFAVLSLGLLFWSDDADARFDGGLVRAAALASSTAERGSGLTYSSLTAAAQPNYSGSYGGDSLGDLFSRPGLIGGFAAGLLGSGLIGLLFGHGVFGELTGAASALGLLFQLALLAMLARLIWRWWHDKKADALAELSPRDLAEAYGRSRHAAVPADIDPAATPDDTPEPDIAEHAAKTECPHG